MGRKLSSWYCKGRRLTFLSIMGRIIDSIFTPDIHNLTNHSSYTTCFSRVADIVVDRHAESWLQYNFSSKTKTRGQSSLPCDIHWQCVRFSIIRNAWSYCQRPSGKQTWIRRFQQGVIIKRSLSILYHDRDHSSPIVTGKKNYTCRQSTCSVVIFRSTNFTGYTIDIRLISDWYPIDITHSSMIYPWILSNCRVLHAQSWE